MIIRKRSRRSKNFRSILLDGKDRFNRIVFEGMKLANYHILRMSQVDGETTPLLSSTFFRNCFHAVSRVNPEVSVPTDMEEKNPSLAESVKAYRKELPHDHKFTHRQGLHAALEHALIIEVATLQNHVKVHLATRITRWLMVQLERKLPQGIAYKHMRALAERMVSRMVNDEGKKRAVIPAWEPPASATELLGEDWLEGRFTDPPLADAALDAIWRIWNTLLEYVGQAKLPLCPTHFSKDNGWKSYYPLLCKILRDVEGAEGGQAVPCAEPLKQPPSKWGKRKC